jgi:pimeloyl-ACP methyl ester carboxylesterase
MDTVFTCWPALEPLAKSLPSRRFPGLFYYGYGPQKTEDKPGIILIHGLGDEGDTWRHIIRPLGDAGYRVLAPDLPGFGRSAIKKRSGLVVHRDAVLELAETVLENNGQGCILVGSSMGCAIAEAAALANNRIKTLILVGGCFPVASPDSSRILLMALPFIGKKWYRSFRTEPEKAWQSLFSYYADIQSLSEDDKFFLRRRVMDRVCSESQEHGYFSSLRSMIFQSLRASYYRRIGSWPGKIAMIWGEKDKIMPVKEAESFIKLRGGNTTELYTIPGAGHLPQQEKPEETAEIILEFLRKQEK